MAIALSLLVLISLILAFIVLYARIDTLKRQLDKFDRLVKSLQDDVLRLQQKLKTEQAVDTSPIQTAEEPITAKPVQPLSEIKPPVQPVTPTAPIPPKPIVSKVEPKSSRSRSEWEQIIGGKLLNRIGALALIIGVGFFLKYAFDKNWISETFRVLIGAFSGIGLLAAALHFEKKDFKVFAQGLIGAGVAILYLSVYASFNFYHLVPQIPAFVLMSIVTAATFLLAIRSNSFAIALLGWAGGFLTPIMLSTGTANEVGLFTYIALLNLGLLAIVTMNQRWILLEALSLIATWLMFFAWADTYYQDSAFGVTIFFVLLFWALFFSSDIIHALRDSSFQPEARQILSALNTLIVYPVLYDLIEGHDPAWSAAATVLFALVHLAVLLVLLRRKGQWSGSVVRYSLTTIALIGIAIAIQFEDFIIPTAWGIQATFLMWFGMRLSKKHIWVSGGLLFLLSVLILIGTPGAFEWGNPAAFDLFSSSRTAAYVSLAAGIWLIAFIAGTDGELLPKRLASALHYCWCVLVAIFVAVECKDLFLHRAAVDPANSIVYHFTGVLTLAILWMMFSIAYVRTATVRDIRPMLYSGFVLALVAAFTAVVRGLEFAPIQSFSPVMNYRLGAMLVIVGGFAWHSFLFKRAGKHERMRASIVIALVAVSLLALTAETRDYFEKELWALAQSGQFNDEYNRLENLKQLSLSSVWLLFSIALVSWGILKRSRMLRIVAFVLFGISILKIFLYDLSTLETLYRIFSFIGLGVILLAVSYLFQRYKQFLFGADEPA